MGAHQEGESVNGNSSFIPSILSLLSFHFAAAREGRKEGRKDGREEDGRLFQSAELARSSQHLPPPKEQKTTKWDTIDAAAVQDLQKRGGLL